MNSKRYSPPRRETHIEEMKKLLEAAVKRESTIVPRAVFA